MLTSKDRQLFYWQGEAVKQLKTWAQAPDAASREKEKARYIEIRQIIEEIEKRGEVHEN